MISQKTRQKICQMSEKGLNLGISSSMNLSNIHINWKNTTNVLDNSLEHLNEFPTKLLQIGPCHTSDICQTPQGFILK